MAHAKSDFERGPARRALTAALAFGLGVVVVATGCSRNRSNSSAVTKPPLVAKVTVDCPGDSAEEVDGMIYPLLFRNTHSILHARTIRCISRSGAFEAYVEADPDANLTDLRNQLTSALPARDLPAGALRPSVLFVKTGIPEVVPKNVPTIDVRLDRQKLNALAVKLSAAKMQIARVIDEFPSTAKAAKTLSETTVVNHLGQHVPLRNFATIVIENRPDCIVRQIPCE